MDDYDNLCAICHEKSYIEDRDSSGLPCSHVFHNECLSMWWNKVGYRSCPYCRSSYDQWSVDLYKSIDNYLIKALRCNTIILPTDKYLLEDSLKPILQSTELPLDRQIPKYYLKSYYRYLVMILCTLKYGFE